MPGEAAALLARDERYRNLLRVLLERPYTERKNLPSRCGLPAEVVEELLPPALESWVIIELASQADSSLESRVPKRVYIINPELEDEVRKALEGR
ncbi:MAG: hypothetical protein AB1609_18895 [Bacillota bacterium]